MTPGHLSIIGKPDKAEVPVRLGHQRGRVITSGVTDEAAVVEPEGHPSQRWRSRGIQESVAVPYDRR